MEIADIITTLGVPTAFCIFAVYALKVVYADFKGITKTYTEKVEAITEAHKDEISQLSAVVDNNTRVVEQVTERLERLEDIVREGLADNDNKKGDEKK